MYVKSQLQDKGSGSKGIITTNIKEKKKKSNAAEAQLGNVGEGESHVQQDIAISMRAFVLLHRFITSP